MRIDVYCYVQKESTDENSESIELDTLGAIKVSRPKKILLFLSYKLVPTLQNEQVRSFHFLIIVTTTINRTLYITFPEISQSFIKVQCSLDNYW